MVILKRSISLILCFFLVLSIPSVYAAVSRLTDGAALLTSDEAAALESKLDELSKKHGIDIAIVTAYGTENGMSAMEYADYFLETNYCDSNNDVNGVLLFIDMKEREWHISTCGSAISNITDYGLEYIENCMISDLSGGYYFDSFSSFAAACDTLLDYKTEQGKPYDYGYSNNRVEKSDPKEAIFGNLLMSAVFGVIVALISVTYMKSQLSSVHMQSGASSYVRPGTFRLTRSNNIFLYKKVSKTRRVQETSSSGSSGRSGGSTIHHSSSGRSFGGRGGKF